MKIRLVETGAVTLVMALFVWMNVVSGLYPYRCKNVIGDLNYIYMNASKKALENELKHELLDVKVNVFERLYNNGENPFSDMARALLEAEIREEERLGQIELLAQLIEAEAGNQDLKGKRLVADVVINRAYERDLDPASAVETIIFEDGQFSCINDGGFDRAGWYISDESFKAAEMEYSNFYNREKLLDRNIIFFTAGYYNPYCKPLYKYGDHYFGY